MMNPLSEIVYFSSASTFELPAYLQQRRSVACASANEPLDILWSNSLTYETELSTRHHFTTCNLFVRKNAVWIAAEADLCDGLHLLVFVIQTVASNSLPKDANERVFIALVYSSYTLHQSHKRRKTLKVSSWFSFVHISVAANCSKKLEKTAL